MKELLVISGKGGTGKTSLVASLACLARRAVLADCDVDAPDLHLVLRPDVERREPFVGGKVARIRADECAACANCEEFCRFGAVSLTGPGSDVIERTYVVNPLACEGCGVCVQFCPCRAIDLEPAVSGEWYTSRTRFGPMVHARLGVACENSGKLVTLVRRQARSIAERDSIGLILSDGPPGIGCPVIASLGGVDLALVVVEPTVSGIHDLDRVLALAERFKVPVMVCVNKCDLNEETSSRIERHVADRHAIFAGRIPYDNAVVKAMMAGQPVVEDPSSEAGRAIEGLWRRVTSELDGPARA